MLSLPLQTLLAVLREGEINVQGLLPWGSNYTFLVRVRGNGQEAPAVYKPTRGERPLWDFPPHTLAQREVAAYVISQALGWDLVPPTVLRSDGPHGPGALQLFVDADPETHYFNMGPGDRADLHRVALFDILVNNADRKGGHIVRDAGGRLWVIDHGICFHAEPKLRTVIWDFAGQPIPEALLADVRAFRERLESDGELQASLRELLSPAEVRALKRRADAVLRAPCYPQPGPGRNTPWPPL